MIPPRLNENAPTPKFKGDWEKKLNQYSKGLTIFQSDQCPYPAKCVPEISETAEKVYDIKPKIIELKSCQDVQDSPCAFGSFCIVYNGRVVADKPISNTMFKNITSKKLKG